MRRPHNEPEPCRHYRLDIIHTRHRKLPGIQSANLHRQLNPPQQQAQVLQQQCPPPKYKLEVVLTPNGQRQLMCVEAQSE